MDSKRTCRLCFDFPESVVDIFQDFEDSTIAAVLMQYLSFLTIYKDDGSSDCLCQTCWTNTKNFHIFYKSVETLQKNHFQSIYFVEQHTFDSHENETANNSNNTVIKLERRMDIVKETNDYIVETEETPIAFDQEIKNEDSFDANYESSESDDSEGNQSTNDEEQFPKVKETSQNNGFCESENSKLDDVDETNRSKNDQTTNTAILIQPTQHIQIESTTKIDTAAEDAQIRQFCNMNCEICNYQFQIFTEAKKHYRKIHKTTGYLTCCRSKYRARGRLLNHIQRHHLNPEGYRCNKCDKNFAYELRLKNHMENHGPRVYKCNVCPSSFTRVWNMTEHKRRRHCAEEDKKFHCDQCIKKFVAKSTLDYHIRRVHEVVYCNICAKECKNKAVFLTHMKEHSRVVQPKDSDEDLDESYVSFEVGVMDLLDFGGPNMMRNGDQVYKASHLLQLGVVSRGETTCKLEGICLQSWHPAEYPHTITIDTAKDFKQWKFQCTCKAGNGGRCKHIYAALLHIHIEKQLELLTCTQLKPNWGKVSKKVAESVLEPETISNLSEMKPFQSKEYEITAEEFERFQEILFSDPKSAVAVFLKRHNEKTSSTATESTEPSCDDDTETEKSCDNGKLTEASCHNGTEVEAICGYDKLTQPICDENLQENDEHLQEFLENLFAFNFQLRQFIFANLSQHLVKFYRERICLSIQEAIDICFKTRDQENMLWRCERKFRITASECYKLYTACRNPNVVWDQKIQAHFKPKPNMKNLSKGRREEANALKLYESQTGQVVTKIGFIIHPTCPWLGCSPDGINFQANTLVEVKTIMNERNTFITGKSK